jgi:hypothetical protein
VGVSCILEMGRKVLVRSILAGQNGDAIENGQGMASGALPPAKRAGILAIVKAAGG